jgi:hypothetical protein
VEEHSAYNPKIEGLNPATGVERGGGKVFAKMKPKFELIF